DNNLVELPGAALLHLTSVTWCDLRYNALVHLPQQISALASLQVLLLQGNRLTRLPPTLGSLQELTTLQVSGNPLTWPPSDVVRGGTASIMRFIRTQPGSAQTTMVCHAAI
ncbi:unnamed protein product, partial [Meganyctiphanes norvegica]